MKNRKLGYAVIGATLSFTAMHFAGCSNSSSGSSILTPGQSDTASAMATVRGYTDSALRGSVQVRQTGDSVRVTAAIAGLQPGKAYAIHIHQVGNCSTPEASGEHFSLDSERHGNPFDTLPMHHRGDLPNLEVGGAGLGQMAFATTDISLNQADSASIIGRSVVVHMNADDFVTQPAGNSGDRIACGVITMGNVADTAKIDTAKTNPNPGYPGTTGVNPGNG